MRTPVSLNQLLAAGTAVVAFTMLAVSPAAAESGASSPALPAVTADNAAVATDVPPVPAGLRTGRRAGALTDVCARAHMQNLGWLDWGCAPAGEVVTVGAPEEGLQLEALSLSVSGANFCLIANVQDIGWGDWVCGADSGTATVGTTGQGLRLEAVGYGVQTGVICGNAFVQDVGWQGWFCGIDGDFNFSGTTGQDKRIEGIAFFVE